MVALTIFGGLRSFRRKSPAAVLLLLITIYFLLMTHVVIQEAATGVESKLRIDSREDRLLPELRNVRVIAPRGAAVVASTNATRKVPFSPCRSHGKFVAIVPERMYAFSAYLDSRDGNVKIPVLVEKETGDDVIRSVTCILGYSDNRTSGQHQSVPGKLRYLGEYSSARYSSLVVECQTPVSVTQQPQLVTLSLTEDARPPANLTFLPICHLVDSPDTTDQVNFAVCSSGPLHYNFSDVNRLVEWIEVNSLFGAEQFVLYNHSGNWKILQPYVDYYSKLGRLQVVQWDLTEAGIQKPVDDVYYFAQVLMENDCLLRNMFHSRYLAFLDIDEFIVPRQDGLSSWLDLVRTCEDAFEYQFRCRFFKVEWPSDQEAVNDANVTKYDLLSLLKTKVEKKIWPVFQRSKYIVQTTQVRSVTVHQVHSFMTGYLGSGGRTCRFLPQVALLHHYRDWQDPKPGWVVDNFMHTHRERILQRVYKTHRMVTGA